MVIDRHRRHVLGETILVAGAFVGFVAIFIAANSFGAEAAAFPKLIAVLGALSALVRLAHDGRALMAPSGDQAASDEADDVNVGGADFLLSYVSPALYAAMLYLLGFWIASAAGLIGLFAALGERRPIIMGGLTVLTLGLIYVLFDLSFGIRMPGSAVFEVLGAR